MPGTKYFSETIHFNPMTVHRSYNYPYFTEKHRGSYTAFSRSLIGSYIWSQISKTSGSELLNTLLSSHAVVSHCYYYHYHRWVAILSPHNSVLKAYKSISIQKHQLKRHWHFPISFVYYLLGKLLIQQSKGEWAGKLSCLS